MKAKPATPAFYLIQLPDSVELFEHDLMRKGQNYSQNIFTAYTQYFFFSMENMYRRVSFEVFIMRLIELGFSCDGIRLEKSYETIVKTDLLTA